MYKTPDEVTLTSTGVSAFSESKYHPHSTPVLNTNTASTIDWTLTFSIILRNISSSNLIKRERDDGAMFLYPAFITPSTLTISLYLLTLPAIVIILLVWFIRKMNRIDRTLIEILKEIKLSKKDKE